MPTKAHDAILDRELTKAASKPIIDLASDLLKEVVNYSTHALVRCVSEPSYRQQEDLALVALYRHIIEMTDGIEVLISQGCVVPTIPLLRSSFESLLYQEYILENDQEYSRRSLSWLVGYAHDRLAHHERLDPTTDKGQEFQRYAQNDTIASQMLFSPSSAADRADLQSFLRQPHIQSIEAEFSKYKRPKWYKLYKGPNDLAALAEHINRRALYDLLYREWSRVVMQIHFCKSMQLRSCI